jgi:hypothetical protein
LSEGGLSKQTIQLMSQDLPSVGGGGDKWKKTGLGQREGEVFAMWWVVPGAERDIIDMICIADSAFSTTFFSFVFARVPYMCTNPVGLLQRHQMSPNALSLLCSS